MKRFWRDVCVKDGEIRLDGRLIRTPGRSPLAIAFPRLAQAIADEWRAVEETIDPVAMPLTGLANAAIDRIAPDSRAFAAGLARYAESDLLCYRAETPAELAVRQCTAWDPLLDWAQQRYDVHFSVATGVIHRPQPAATIVRLGEAVAARSAFELAGLSPIVTVTGSLVAALAVLEGAASAESVWHAARVDEQWQVDHWGEDEEARHASAGHHADLGAGARFLSLL